MAPLVWSSVARIIAPELRDAGAAAWRPVSRSAWADGDYVVAEVESREGGVIEATDGHPVRVARGDLVVCVLGARRATLEVVGDWRSMDAGERMQTLTRAGVVGRLTSVAVEIGRLVIDLRYRGHLELAGAPARMSDHSLPASAASAGPLTPAVVLIGTSMSSGKTTTARFLIRRLLARGMTVAGAKLAGVARFTDILAMRDSGAVECLDFVDAGLPSTIAPPATVVAASERVLGAIDARAPDVLVAEVGASPLEPYQGEAVMELMAPRTRLVVLCASDPYAVLGAVGAFGMRPDLVTGRAASTSAAVALVSRLSGLEAVDATDPDAWPRIDELLARALRPDGAPADRAASALPQPSSPNAPSS